MPKKTYTAIWSAVGFLALYSSLNMYLYSQGSGYTFGYPDFSEMGKDTIPVYAMIIFIPNFLIFLWLSNSYLKEYKPSHWLEGFPIAFNVKLSLPSKASKRYQQFFFVILFIIPVLFQVISLVKLFDTKVFIKNKEEPHTIIAKDFYSHLFHFEPFDKTFADNYRIGDPKCADKSITYFPAYESWFFLLLELFIFYEFIRYLIRLYTIRKTNDPAGQDLKS